MLLGVDIDVEMWIGESMGDDDVWMDRCSACQDIGRCSE